MIGGHLIKDIEVSSAGRNVDAFVFLLEEQVIRVAGTSDTERAHGDRFTAIELGNIPIQFRERQHLSCEIRNGSFRRIGGSKALRQIWHPALATHTYLLCKLSLVEPWRAGQAEDSNGKGRSNFVCQRRRIWAFH